MFLEGTPLKFNSEFTPEKFLEMASKSHQSIIVQWQDAIILRGVRIKWLKNSFGNMSQIDKIDFP